MEILIKRYLTGRVFLGRAIIPGQKQWQPILGIEFHATNEKSHHGLKGPSLFALEVPMPARNENPGMMHNIAPMKPKYLCRLCTQLTICLLLVLFLFPFKS